LLHVHQLAFPRADEVALLRPDPTAPLGLDLRAQFQEPVDQRLRSDRATGDEDVRRDEGVGTLDDAVGVVVRPAANRALPHRDDPLHEVLRSEADDVRLLRTLDHPLRPPVRAAGRSRKTRISESPLTLRPRVFMIDPPPDSGVVRRGETHGLAGLKVGALRLTWARGIRVLTRRPTTVHRRRGRRDSGVP